MCIETYKENHLYYCFSFSYEELEQMQNYSGSVTYEGYKHQLNGEAIHVFAQTKTQLVFFLNFLEDF